MMKYVHSQLNMCRRIFKNGLLCVLFVEANRKIKLAACCLRNSVTIHTDWFWQQWTRAGLLWWLKVPCCMDSWLPWVSQNKNINIKINTIKQSEENSVKFNRKLFIRTLNTIFIVLMRCFSCSSVRNYTLGVVYLLVRHNKEQHGFLRQTKLS